MIDLAYGKIWEVTCDVCSAGFEEIPCNENDHAADAEKALRKKGWLAQYGLHKVGLEGDEDVKHVCPDCVEERKRP